jgi:hypothetical protein
MPNFKDTHGVQESEYKGHPTLMIPVGESREGEVYHMTIGLKKAKRLLEYIDEIEACVIKMDEEGK